MLTLLVFLSFPTSADQSRPGWWLGAFSKAEIDSNWSGWMETQVRNNLETGRMDQLLFRTGFLRKIEDQEVGALIGFIQTGTVLERRFTLQQGMTYSQSDNSKLSHRLRLEWRDFADTTDDAVRFRYLIRHTQNFDPFELILWNEFFLNLSDESKSNQGTFERNRLFVGTQLMFGKTKAEVGYMNQAILRKTENTFEHLGIINWIF